MVRFLAVFFVASYIVLFLLFGPLAPNYTICSTIKAPTSDKQIYVAGNNFI